MPRVIYWFRSDLRLHDSPALIRSLELKPEYFFPIWTWDPYFNFDIPVGPNRYNFLLESMREIDSKLKKLNDKSKLHVFRASPTDILPVLFKVWNITHLVFEKDPAPSATERDEKVKKVAKDAGVEVFSINGHSLYDIDEIVSKNNGEPTMTARTFKKCAEGMKINRPANEPSSIPPPDDLKLDEIKKSNIKVDWKRDVNEEHREGSITVYDYLCGINDNLDPPTLDELAIKDQVTTSIHGGEEEGLNRLENYVRDKAKTALFKKPQTSPAEFDPPATTLLSPYLKFGCLGVREFYWRVIDTIEEYKKSKKNVKVSSEPENLPGQLIFREMYFAAQLAVGKTFGQIKGNKICRSIDWKLKNDYDNENNLIIPRPKGNKEDEDALEKWKNGQTGFPWIDACMKQLKQEGWMHHLARHSVACFLTRNLYISWERGAEVFDRYLIDWDPACNSGNWMWLSCSAFFSQYYRIYGLKSFPEKYDKTGKLVRKYCPELSDYPDKYIYNPYEAPEDVQKKAKCIIGKDYPSPIVDEKESKSRCLNKLKEAYSKKKFGIDELKRSNKEDNDDKDTKRKR